LAHRREPWIALVIALSLTLVSTRLSAQAGTAAFSGTVTDQQGAALPGVTVTITSTSTRGVRTATTNAAGVYQLLAVPPGTYTVTCELGGFRTAVRSGTSSREFRVPTRIAERGTRNEQ
jgi:protocatechuate 3,4-dioxygenase beta subunit